MGKRSGGTRPDSSSQPIRVRSRGQRPETDAKAAAGGDIVTTPQAGGEAPSVISGKDSCGKRLVRPPITTDAEGWSSASGLTQREAEELLDWLEANGYGQREVTYTPGPGVTVRWRR
jgi:hypothetical protein